MPLHKFRRAGGRVGSPAISVVDDGRIALNAAAARAFSEAAVKKICLFWDPDTSLMVLEAAPKNDPDSYAVSIPENLHSGSLRAKNFLGYIGWTATGREMLPGQWDEKKKRLSVTVPPQFVKPK